MAATCLIVGACMAASCPQLHRQQYAPSMYFERARALRSTCKLSSLQSRDGVVFVECEEGLLSRGGLGRRKPGPEYLGPTNRCRLAAHARGAAQDDTYVPLQNNYGAVWEGKNLPPPPLDAQITNGAGTTLVAAHFVQNGSTGDVPTSVQFTLSSS